MGAIAFQITGLTIVYSTVYSDAVKKTHQSSALLVFVRGTHRGSVNSPHKWPVKRKMFPFDDVIVFAGQIPNHSRCKNCKSYSSKYNYIYFVKQCCHFQQMDFKTPQQTPRSITKMVIIDTQEQGWGLLKRRSLISP